MLRRTTASLFARRTAVLLEGGMNFTLTSEQKALQEAAHEFAAKEMKPVAAKYDQSMDYPQDIFEKAWKLGFVNMHVPAIAGGLDLGCTEGLVVQEELGWACAGMATAMEANSLAAAPLLVAGSDAQKKKYLGRLTEAPIQAAYGVTEPGAGSDVQGLKTSCVKKGNTWVINGQKMWITNGGRANWYFVLARSKEDGFCGFIVDRDTPGVEPGKKEIMLGQRCSDTRGITFTEVVVPEENLLGKAGDGFKYAMKAFDFTRPPVAILGVAIARRALEEARDYSLQRKTFGKAIAEHQGVAHRLADMAAGTEAARLLAFKSAWEADNGMRNTLTASMAKKLAAENCEYCVAQAVNIFGGNGYNTGYPVEKLYRDSAIIGIYEGTTSIQKNIISKYLLGQVKA
jgi:acyl-CoA dehydrogenase